MNEAWKAFLESQSATFDAAGRATFPASAAGGGCELFDLSHLGLIRVSGEDAATFLQGQTSNDVRNLERGGSQMSSVCTPKGRMIANFRLFAYDGDFLLQMPVETQAPLLKRLPMFILRSRVRVWDAGDELVRIGIAGPEAEALLKAAVSELPPKAGEGLARNGFHLYRLPGDPPRFQAVGEAEAVEALWRAVAPGATPGSAEGWSLLTIRAGVPTVHGATAEAFVPQMANMDLVNGVSFTKGCYTGQEVVARMRYLGKMKRRMYRARVEAERYPLPGEELFSAASDSPQGAGRVVDAAPSPDGGYELLAVAEIALHEQNDLHLESATGPRLEFLGLPYALAEE